MPVVRVRSMPRQLALFPGRQKKPPKVLEFAKQCVIADACDRWLSAGWKWTHLPFGEYRTKATAGKLKRMGVKPGWPDLLFVSPKGWHHYVELKREGETLNKAQEDVQGFLEAVGCPYLLSTDVGLILRTLQAWGALRSDMRFN
jgi:hypothetical protein